MRTCDVGIVGAGPAGCLAAYELAKGGAGVVLLEKAELPRTKVCGGGVVARAWRQLPGELVPPREVTLQTAEVWHGFERLARVTRGAPFLHMIMRSDFDASLANAARRAGAELRTGEGLVGLRRNADHVTLVTGQNEYRARFVLAADGTGGPTARLAGWRRPQTAIPAIEAEVEVADATRRRFAAARFDLRFPEGGYSWVFPKHDHLSIGVLSTRRPAPVLGHALEQYMCELAIEDVTGFESRGFRIPVRPRVEGLAHGRVLLLGDAAGLADPLTLEGISNALFSGKLAARALVAGRFVAGAVERTYAALLARPLLADLSAGALLARMLYARSGIVDRILRRSGPRVAERLLDVFEGRVGLASLLRGRARRVLAVAFGVATRESG